MSLNRFLTAALMALATTAWASEFDVQGTAVYVTDGDTLTILADDHQQIKVRLSSIDAPENSHTNKEQGRIGQPYAENSKRYLAALLKGKAVQAHCFELDRYERSVCEIFVDGRSANREMVRSGLAWANMASRGRYLRDKSLLDLEASARAEYAGLWAGRKPVEPWLWREACWTRGQCQ